MERRIDLAEISDGKRYGSEDMVKAGCADCQGRSACCGRSLLSGHGRFHFAGSV